MHLLSPLVTFGQLRLVEGAYVQLEDAYCLRSVEEAMRIAEPIEVGLNASPAILERCMLMTCFTLDAGVAAYEDSAGEWGVGAAWGASAHVGLPRHPEYSTECTVFQHFSSCMTVLSAQGKALWLVVKMTSAFLFRCELPPVRNECPQRLSLSASRHGRY